MNWNQHGSYHLEWRGDVLVARYEGVWNEVASRKLHRDAKALWQAHEGRWAMVSLFDEWEGATPEAFQRWMDFFLDATAHGLGAYAVKMPTGLLATVVEPVVKETTSRVERRECEDLPDALSWLGSLGFRT